MQVEELTGIELRELKELLGRPFATAIEEGDTDAMYAFVWIGERRHDPDLTFDDVLARPFGDVIAYFAEAQEPDPTSGKSGGG